jgi:hypothetical protein
MDWQTIIAILCVVFAAAVLLRKLWNFLHPAQSGCAGGCSGCEAAQSSAPTMISLTLPADRSSVTR